MLNLHLLAQQWQLARTADREPWCHIVSMPMTRRLCIAIAAVVHAVVQTDVDAKPLPADTVSERLPVSSTSELFETCRASP